MEIEFTGDVWFWRGPAPHHFVSVPADKCGPLQDAARLVSYGWGMIPVSAYLQGTQWTTSLFPKDGGYIVPLKLAVRKAERIEVGDAVALRLVIDVRIAP